MKKLILTLLAGIIPATALWAVPARHGLLRFTQPDGSVIELRKTGDEYSHITLSPEGYPVTADAEGFYCFAEIDESYALRATDVRVAPVHTLDARSRAEIGRIDLSRVPSLITRRAEDAAMSPSRAPGGIGLKDDAFLGRKELNGLVILAQYQDVKFTDSSLFDEMLNEEGFNKYSGTGSARDYFIDASDGQFTPQFDVYGPVTLPENMAYYGGNNSSGSDSNAARMIYDACKALDGEINFKDYDLDGDGYVDNVFLFYAGYGEASYGPDDSVWPHQWSLSAAGLSLTLDGVRINKYACANELEKDSRGNPIPDGVGTFIHEFSHVLGLPDLYVTQGDGYWTPGIWSVLDQGPYNNNGRTPPTYSVYERYSMGWIEPRVLSGRATVELQPIITANEACIIPTDKDNEFFLLENRQQTGWDKYIPGHGMLIWHVDYNKTVWSRNTVNNLASHNYVDIEEACGTTYSPYNFSSTSAYYNALAGYAFPGTKKVTSFTDDTNPSMKTWGGIGLGLPLTSIAENSGVISFLVKGGGCDADVPVTVAPTAKGDGWFEATWLAAEGAQAYLLDVDAYFDEGINREITADFGNETDSKAVLPEGWTLVESTGEVFSTSGNYGESAPALKLTKTGAGFITETFDADIMSVKFWLKGQMTNASSGLVIDGLLNDSWVSITSVVPSTTARTVTVDDIPEGIRALRFTYSKSVGNIGIDDVCIRLFGAGYRDIESYTMLNVGTATSYKVDALPANATHYRFRVCSVDVNGRNSDWSQEQVVDLGSNAGIDDITADGELTFGIDGLTVTCSSTVGSRIALLDLTGRTVDSATVSAGDTTLHAPAPGLYILSLGGHAVKVMLQ